MRRPKIFVLAFLAGAMLGGCKSAPQTQSHSQETPVGEPEESTDATETSEPTSIESIALGSYVSYAIDDTGGVWAWGLNSGRLGDGTTRSRHEPVRIEFDSPIMQVAAGFSHGCAIDRSNRLYCWGTNARGELGDGTEERRLSPVRVAPEMRFRQVACGEAATCALTLEGEAYCWGLNGNGRVGNGTTSEEETTPQKVASEARFVELTAKINHSCGLTEGGDILCWGSHPIGDTVAEPQPLDAQPVPVEQLSPGIGWHGCGIDGDGAAYCWGQGSGPLGYPTREARRAFPDKTFDHIVTGDQHMCGLTMEGVLGCWGSNRGFQSAVNGGQLGGGTYVKTSDWTEVELDASIRQVAAGAEHTCALSQDGRVWCWGSDQGGQVGDGSPEPRPQPEMVRLQTAEQPFEDVDALGTPGRIDTCVLTGDGRAYCAGIYGIGQFKAYEGPSGVDYESVPGDHRFEKLVSERDFACGITNEGETLCWGKNRGGVLGDGTKRARKSPEPVSGDRDFTTIFLNEGFVCGLDGEGKLYCWGDEQVDSPSELTDEERGALLEPRPASDVEFEAWLGACGVAVSGDLHCWDDEELFSVTPPKRFVEVVENGRGSFCGWTEDGEAYCWGDNYAGNLGVGHSRDVESPTSIGGEHQFEHIWMFMNASFGRTRAGEMLAWGANSDGGLGIGRAGTAEYSPTLMAVDRPFEAVFSHRNFMAFANLGYGVSGDGKVYTWGFGAHEPEAVLYDVTHTIGIGYHDWFAAFTSEGAVAFWTLDLGYESEEPHPLSRSVLSPARVTFPFERDTESK